MIELLVVIAILSLLVSILLPSLSRARELAKSAICLTNAKQIGTSLYLYSSDYDGLCPIPPNGKHPQCLLHVQMGSNPPDEDYPSGTPNPAALKGQKTPFNCPSMLDNEYGWGSRARGTTLDYFPVPGKTLINSYTVSELTFHWKDWDNNSSTPLTPSKVDVGRIPNAADYMYAFDGRGSFRADGNDAFVEKEINGPLPGDQHIEKRHPGSDNSYSVNALFYDGHAEGGYTAVGRPNVKWYSGGGQPP
ncbi:MAG TPA: hypothetical protein DCX07_00160 [Phycisphaerales bacterium]|nr:hypothetical protein [Phycisphaerales bacterium]